MTPEAGNQVTTALPDEQFFILPAGLPRNSLDPLNPQTFRALNGFYYAAEGGDVSVDNPIVTLEFQGENGFSTINLGDSKVANSDGPAYAEPYPSPAKTSDLHRTSTLLDPCGKPLVKISARVAGPNPTRNLSFCC